MSERHFTMILWPQCSLGTSGTEHLSTASSWKTKDEKPVRKDRNTTQLTQTYTVSVYPDAMVTLRQKRPGSERMMSDTER